MHMQKALLFLSTFFILYHVNAQFAEKDFIQYTVRDGLSENSINCLNQDDWGYMWIGTDIGLNRFDGHSFAGYFQGSKTLPLLSGSIRKLKSFGEHKLGIITRAGFQILNTKDLAVKNYVIPDTTALSVYRNMGWDAVALPGKEFAVTTASGFYVFEAAGKLAFRYDAHELKDIGQKRILYGHDIFPVEDNKYLVYVNENELAYYDAAKKFFFGISKANLRQLLGKWADLYPVPEENNFGLVSQYQLSPDEYIFIHFDDNRILYYNRASKKAVVSSLNITRSEFNWESNITLLNDSSFLINGSISGFYLFHLNRQTGEITADSEKKLPGYKIKCLYLDKDKRLWAGTSMGLLQQKLVQPAIHSFSYQPRPSDSLTGGFSCAYRCRDKIYIGRFSLYKGLLITDAITKKAEKEISFFGKNTSWNEIRSIQMYHPDTLWIGTNGGLLWFDTKTLHYGKLAEMKGYSSGVSGLNILAPVNKDGYAWMCSYLDGMVARYHTGSRTFTIFTSNTEPALPFDKVKSVAYDSYGDVWIGGHSLARWNERKQQFDTVISIYGGANRFEDDIVTMVADHSGSLWLHNAFNGLLEYRIREKKFVSYTTKDGLPADVFYGFSPVINDELWMASHNQLTRFNTVTKKVKVYDYADGLPEGKPSGRYLYFDSAAGELYLFNQHILSAISIPELQTTSYGNNLMIEELTVNDSIRFSYPPAGLQLQPGQNNLSLHFGIIDFESGNSYRFSYKLNNAETWTELGEQRNINLTGLSAGNYSIQLKGTGKSGLQKTTIFSFAIAPPFWKTTWFLLSTGLLTAGLIYFLFRRRIKKIRERAEIDKQLLEAEMKALHAQMNPHFIFNSLNSIREMILSNENKEASHFLGKFAHLIRMTLDQSGQSFISLRNTMEYLTRYIEMEQIRNGYFTSRILADDALDPDETVFPPMLIQPFVENAIWHGTDGKQKNININIEFKKEDDKVVCIIEDNGIGINRALSDRKKSNDMHHSTGIENVHNRIRLLNEKYNQQSSVSIEDKNDLPCYTGTGTVATLKLPLEIIET